MPVRSWVLLPVLGLAILLAACDSTRTDPLLRTQDYGKQQQYQIEISLNCTNAHNCTEANLPPGSGMGIWLWLELNDDGTGDYTGSDCGHFHYGPGEVDAGAIADLGDVEHWYDDTENHRLVIEGVELFGGALGPMTITVPDTLGHYKLDGFEVFPTLGYLIGAPDPTHLGDTTQVQVAP